MLPISVIHFVSGILISWSETSRPYQSFVSRDCCVFKKKHCGSRACVWTIWRDVKLLLLQFPNFRGRGDHPCTVSDGPTKRPQYMRISRLITVTYLLFQVHFLHWDVANRRTTMPFSNNLFSTCPGGNDLVRWNIASSSGLEILSSWSFSDLFINLFLSGITGLFLHVGCIPHQNSQRLFWASVCPFWHVLALIISFVNSLFKGAQKYLPRFRCPFCAGSLVGLASLVVVFYKIMTCAGFLVVFNEPKFTISYPQCWSQLF